MISLSHERKLGAALDSAALPQGLMHKVLNLRAESTGLETVTSAATA
jgi:hypothetical protein